MSRILKRIFTAGVFLIIINESFLYAENPVKPVDTKNTFVLYISHLFMPAEASSIDANYFNNSRIQIIQSNTIFDIYHFMEHGKEGKFDVETTSQLFHYTRKIDDLTEIKFMLPFYYHGGGFMDRFIEGFHKAFPGDGLKNGGREYGGDDEIHIQYQPDNGGPDINRSFYGAGDPSFFLKRILYDSNPGITLSLGVKPQFGDKAFINSGTTDFGVTINADYNYGIFYLYTMAGYSYFYGNGIYKDGLDQFKNYMLSSAMGGGVSFTDCLFFSVQFYIHTSLYKTGIEKIDYITIINSYSLAWQINRQLLIQFCIDEDPITYATADIAFSVKSVYSF